ncbi:hypothetical protein N656DRAFT_776365 [Canariomyces notabilis]|uniref:Uncharacterized protein n=1 Tax=Canariomyces notabilis TaxID=2074819 RepID=A0AAN6YW95_9PEZI|nr:hypothetical protein N656DRAFT_776365 [Canariomyces arenarius]
MYPQNGPRICGASLQAAVGTTLEILLKVLPKLLRVAADYRGTSAIVTVSKTKSQACLPPTLRTLHATRLEPASATATASPGNSCGHDGRKENERCCRWFNPANNGPLGRITASSPLRGQVSLFASGLAHSSPTGWDSESLKSLSTPPKLFDRSSPIRCHESGPNSVSSAACGGVQVQFHVRFLHLTRTLWLCC